MKPFSKLVYDYSKQYNSQQTFKINIIMRIYENENKSCLLNEQLYVICDRLFSFSSLIFRINIYTLKFSMQGKSILKKNFAHNVRHTSCLKSLESTRLNCCIMLCCNYTMVHLLEVSEK